ncbi:putative (DUF1639)-RELATED [Salix koriyanagi]|uniref:(DUF1639)-RELATED n=1 Tax=Salix koriyanagi TaxID=2511006 RepID=A0A9Q0VBG5_9ROSI|nr:putative (DUF1639)-RELATED [Salix koriyanagi]
MRGGQSKVGGLRRVASPGKGAHDERSNNNHLHHQHNSINHENHNHNNKSAASSDSKKGGRSSSGGSGEPPPPPPPPPPPFWPPKFDIALTNKEKEEDFFAFKGSKLPQRPKKRAKFIQRSLNVRPSTPLFFFLQIFIRAVCLIFFLIIIFQCYLNIRKSKPSTTR